MFGARGRGEITVLDDVSFTVAAGELVAIVGPSGAGKTTLLDAVAGIVAPAAGSVRFDGVDLHANLRKFRGAIGYVPQDDIIHADLPLRHTLRYAARLRLPSSTTATQTIDAVGPHAAIDTGGADRVSPTSGSVPAKAAASASGPASPSNSSLNPAFSSWTSRRPVSTQPRARS